MIKINREISKDSLVFLEGWTLESIIKALSTCEEQGEKLGDILRLWGLVT